MFPVLLLVAKVGHITKPRWSSPPGVRRLALKHAPATIPDEAWWWAVRLRTSSAEPTGGSATHWATVAVEVEIPVVDCTVFVVAENSVGRAYGNEALWGVWVIAVTVGVMDFAQLKVASGAVVSDCAAGSEGYLLLDFDACGVVWEPQGVVVSLRLCVDRGRDVK